VSAPSSVLVRRASAIAAAAALAIGLGACGIGHKESHPHFADNEAFYVDAGPMTYQVQLTRQLNPWATEDKAYLEGVTDPTLAPHELWFGVFLWARNQTETSQSTTAHFTLTDSAGNVYNPVDINPSLNPYAWTSQELEPGGTQPAPDTTASYGPTQGQLVLFKLPDTVYSNRPLTLNIYPENGHPATVSLDL
jgi:hypothetical protein